MKKTIAFTLTSLFMSCLFTTKSYADCLAAYGEIAKLPTGMDIRSETGPMSIAGLAIGALVTAVGAPAPGALTAAGIDGVATTQEYINYNAKSQANEILDLLSQAERKEGLLLVQYANNFNIDKERLAQIITDGNRRNVFCSKGDTLYRMDNIVAWLSYTLKIK